MVMIYYGEFKIFKYSDLRFENVFVEFSEEKLRFMYKLFWGIFGEFFDKFVVCR